MVIDIVVLQCGLSGLTVRFIESIRDTAGWLHVILIDNGSPEPDLEAAEQALEQIPWHTVIRNGENLGFAKAVNQGIQAGSGEFVCIQNNDTVMQRPGDHLRLAEHLERWPNLGCIGPFTNAADTAQRVPGPDAVEAEKSITETDGLVAFFCAMLPRRVIDEVGPLSEEFGLGYGEDDDYCIRLRRAGYRLAIARDVYVHHDHHQTYLRTIGQDGIDREGAQGHAKLQELYGNAR